jgi:hypothetical protein
VESLGFAFLFFSLVFFEQGFPQANRLGRDFDEFVVFDVFEGEFEGSSRGDLMVVLISAVEARMLVSFFSRQMLTGRSLSRQCSPTTWPS